MAVQSKTLIGDVGSAVLAESISQLNQAAGYATSTISATLASGAQSFVVCRFSEDVYVTSVEFGFGNGGGALNHNADAVALVTGSTPDGLGGATVCSASDFNPGNFATSNVYATMADLQAVAATNTGSDAPFSVDAGDSVALQIVLNGASAAVGAVVECISVTYRPVKDYLKVDPVYTKTMQNFSTVDR